MAKKKEVIKNALFFYEEMKAQSEKAISESLTKDTMRLTANGKKYYLFPLVEQHGFNTWDKIKEEFLLIAVKQSKLSTTLRIAIENIVYHVNHRLNTHENLQTVKKLTESGSTGKMLLETGIGKTKPKKS